MDNQNSEKAYYLVIEHIKTLFQKKELSFGEKLPSERQLMTTLGLGRNSVREALRSLENMGILESRQGQGNFLVNRMGNSLGSIFSLLLFMEECSYPEISQLRRSIEIGAYLLAIKNAREPELESFTRALHELQSSSGPQRARADKKFHDVLVQISGNRLLILLSETLSQLFESAVQKAADHIPPREWEPLMEYHVQIYQCLIVKKESDGIAAINAHYDLVEKEPFR